MAMALGISIAVNLALIALIVWLRGVLGVYQEAYSAYKSWALCLERLNDGQQNLIDIQKDMADIDQALIDVLKRRLADYKSRAASNSDKALPQLTSV